MPKIIITNETMINGNSVAVGSIVEVDEQAANMLRAYSKGRDATPEDIKAAEKTSKATKKEGE